MTDLRELYQEVILDHSKNPRNRRVQNEPTGTADGHNPLCGDRLTVFLTVEDDVIRDVSFEGQGCAISTASASMMTAALKGQPVERAYTLFETFHDMVTGKVPAEDVASELGKLAVFSGVCEFPVRVKCATLAWHTLKAALESETPATVTTE
jgi:nitrogen fixation NifU-like protein